MMKVIFFILSLLFFTNIFSKEISLRDEIGQMLIIGFGGFKQDVNGKILWNDKDSLNFSEESLLAKHIRDEHIGGVILFQKAIRDIKTKKFIRDRNIQSPKQVTILNENLQDYNKQTRKQHNLEELPLFIGVDQEGGSINRLPAAHGFSVPTLTPQALGLVNDAAKTYEYAEKIAEKLFDLHFNLNFFPVVDVNINPINPIIGGLGRSFSANPDIVVEQSTQFIEAFNKYNIVSAIKHFPGHGSSTSDSHLGLVDVTDTYKKEIELKPYYDLIANNYDGMIMTTHVINGQLDQTQCTTGIKTDHSTWCPGTMSEKTLTDLLRKEMGFKGIIISDDMTMSAITNEYSLDHALKNAINAGVDIFIIANHCEDQTEMIIDTIEYLVANGDIKREKINAAYNRIVEFKKKHLLW
jgi:beta-N-acetylhexosaminidase